WLVFPWGRDQVEAGVAARDDEDHCRCRNLAVLQPERFDVTGEMIDRDEGLGRRPRCRLRERDADEQRTDESRPLGHGNCVELVPGGRGHVECALDRAADIAEMLPCGQFGY